MGIEIERKFLVLNDTWRHTANAGTRYRQGYLSGAPDCSVRVRIEGDRAALNIKSATLGITRREFEYAIPVEDAQEMLNSLCRSPLIEKTRYLVRHAGHTWEIDEFAGDNAGLVVAEIELQSVDETFTPPDWVGDEVSDDPRYYNVCLADHPYKQW